MGIKQRIKGNKSLFWLAARMYSFLGRNKVYGKKGNNIDAKGVRLKRCKIEIRGYNNVISIMDGSKLCECQIEILGSNNRIVIEHNATLYGVNLHLEDDDNLITIGEKTVIYEKTELATIEGTQIEIGKECLISSEVDVRTGDSHSLLNEYGRRDNWSQNVQIKDHVWIGTRAMVLKGTIVEKDCVVGAGAVLVKSCLEKGCVIAGNPAKIVKKGISWDERR